MLLHCCLKVKLEAGQALAKKCALDYSGFSSFQGHKIQRTRYSLKYRKDDCWYFFKVNNFFCNVVTGYSFSLRFKRNINDLKSVGLCAFY